MTTQQHHPTAPLLSTLIVILGFFTAAARAAVSDVFVYGDSPTSHAQHQGTAWTYDAAGGDWAAGVDATGKPWVCSSGQQQSPINLLTSGTATTAVANEHRATYELGALTSNGSSIRVSNNGHSVQVSWAASAAAAAGGGAATPRVTVVVKEGQPVTSSVQLRSGDTAVRSVVAVPQQFHFHAHSEHLLQGHLFPMEAHLVSIVPQSSLPSCPPSGCIVVTGVLFELSDDLVTGSDWLEPLFQAMPLNEGGSTFLPAGAALDLQQLLPPGNQSYISYAGSLTTPPCTEGVLWVMLLNTQKMSLQQLRRFMTAVGDYNCTLQADQAGANSSSNNSPGSNTTSKRGRRLLDGEQQQQQQADTRRRAVLEALYSCKKLEAGSNYRLPQPLNGRVLRVWRDVDNSKKGYLPEDAATAASAGAVAGIVVGTTLGAVLTALFGWVGYREYQKRRLKRYYKYGVSSGDMLSMQREVETQFLNTNKAANGSAGQRGALL